ncbi:MAG: FG-GAP-like repeat-containing protein [Desulfobacterales bacterium]|nr:FG-GAP-like repeat-containing protein [Desulfobacterales bacterium]
MLTSMRVTSGKGLIVAVLTALIVLTAGPGICKEAKKVAVLPFKMNSPQDLGFLQNGLFSMLSSRLSDPGKVDVLDRQTVDKALADAQGSDSTKGDLNEGKARLIGAALGVDYVLFGSLTHFGESVSLDGSMVDVTGKKESISFFEQSNSMGDVIPLVNEFAGDVNRKMFNRRINNELYAQPVPQEAPAPGGLQYAGGQTMYGGGMMSVQAGGQGLTNHLKFNDIIRAMTTGDLNSDGTTQIITATDSNLMIYHLDGTMLTLEKTLEYESYVRIVGLDVADINGNGYPEIFVSAMTIHKDSMASFIVEFDGNNYVTLVDGEAQYYRVVETKDDIPVLLAQDKGEDPFSGRIHIMTANGNEYEEVKRIRMPRGTSVLSLAKGPVTAEDGEDYLTINRHQRLVATNDVGGEEWASTGKYGGTNTVWLMPKAENDASYRERIYFNPRIKFFPVGEDQKLKAFVVKNSEIGGGTFGRYKKFKEGHIQVMSWNGISMAPVFQTMPVQGWISDFDVADIDGDGEAELVVSVVTRTKLAILSKDKASNIISYKLK